MREMQRISQHDIKQNPELSTIQYFLMANIRVFRFMDHSAQTL